MQELDLMDIDRVAGGVSGDTGFDVSVSLTAMDYAAISPEWSATFFPSIVMACDQTW
ncbi:hypothetical protein ACUHMQ_20225 [Chitinimonas sp. PSY-7]|uniref:hypothetical protein n=1 Tax=Chitinimonas sp. PSY-7 TaxID=3459088 RepID=UPI00403FD775